MNVSMRMTEMHHQILMSHLYPGDGMEAVAIALCGMANDVDGGSRLLVHDVVPIPYEHCSYRAVNRVTWNSTLLPEILDRAEKNEWSIVKFHSHPQGGVEFSEFDDESDQALFPKVYSWVNSDLVHASVIVTPDGMMVGRLVSKAGEFSSVKSIWMVGDDIKELNPWAGANGLETPEFAKRVSQTFGEKTFSILQGLKVGVVGCSGTGGPVIEQLVRNCVGSIVLVDPDHVDDGNLNRITNSTAADARDGVAKVEMHRKAIDNIGLGTHVTAHHSDLFNPEVVRSLSCCDVIFGCMDTVDGRHLLNKLATYYLIPYIDVGVKLIADGEGGIRQVCCQAHYLQPGRSSLYSRGVYTLEQLSAASLYRTDPAAYEREKNEGYIDGVNVDKPAVVSVNTLAASIAVNDMLARLHPYRRAGNASAAVTRITLTDMFMVSEPEGEPCEMFRAFVGRGDTQLLLNTPELSEMEAVA